MQADEFRAWLADEALAEEIGLVARLSAAAEFAKLEKAADLNAPDLDWPRLLLGASILATSAARAPVEAALRLATAATTLPDVEPTVRDAGALVLERLGNARGVGLAVSRGLILEQLGHRLGLHEGLLAVRRRLDDSILLLGGGTMPANRFQRVFWEAAGQAEWLSASAPTATGKTHVVLRWLLDRLAAGDARTAVYLAPTRALVGEIEAELRELAPRHGLGGLTVSSLPLRVAGSAGGGGPRRPLVYVLTQERLQLLANDGGAAVDLLVVDEAHKVGDPVRGVVLLDAVERVVRANPHVRLVFLSPATDNPEELLADAPPGVRTGKVDNDAATVCQNLIAAAQVPGNTKRWLLSLVRGSEHVPLGTVGLVARPTNPARMMALLAEALGGAGGTMVYANGAVDAEKVAALIADLRNHPADSDGELRDLAELVQVAIHPKFSLRSLVRKGVGFHYGNMPSIVRAEVERLFREGRVSYLACTSTLVEGVNLACRTILIRGPRRGRGNVMEAHDFWNLAGRAGRWGHDFQGNIVCVQPHLSAVWPEGIPARTKHRIVRETDAAMANPEGLARYVEERWDAQPRALASAERTETVAAYLLATWLREGGLVAAPWTRRMAPALLERLEIALAAAASRVEIPAEMAARHCGISAIGMQRLLDRFRERKKPVETLLLTPPEADDAYERLVSAFHRINSHVFPTFGHPKGIRLAARVTHEWVQGRPLPRIIDRRIKHALGKDKAMDVQSMIRDTMLLVEQVARHKAPKYLSSYLDVLGLHLREIGREDLLRDDLRFNLYLEFGVATGTLLSLVGLGLSRTSALALGDYIAKDDLGPEQCLAWVRQRDLDELTLPRAVRAEIHRKLVLIIRDTHPELS